MLLKLEGSEMFLSYDFWSDPNAVKHIKPTFDQYKLEQAYRKGLLLPFIMPRNPVQFVS